MNEGTSDCVHYISLYRLLVIKFRTTIIRTLHDIVLIFLFFSFFIVCRPNDGLYILHDNKYEV